MWRKNANRRLDGFLVPTNDGVAMQAERIRLGCAKYGFVVEEYTGRNWPKFPAGRNDTNPFSKNPRFARPVWSIPDDRRNRAGHALRRLPGTISGSVQTLRRGCPGRGGVMDLLAKAIVL